jgi:hypothetical protein
MIIIILKWFGMFNSNASMILYDHTWLHVNMPHGIFKWFFKNINIKFVGT